MDIDAHILLSQGVAIEEEKRGNNDISIHK
jgi:hypothetical protein